MKENSRHIILNWGLPAIPSFPSPAMSILKSRLKANGYEVKVVYWNFHLKPVVEHYWERSIEDNDDHLVYYLSPIFAYIALEMGDRTAILKQQEHWNLEHRNNRKSLDEYLIHIQANSGLMRNVIFDVLKKYNFKGSLYIGFYQKLFQMYGADIISRIIKQQYPDTTIVLGGIDTKDEALASIDNFHDFDYALWGEGDFTILNFTEMLLGNIMKQDVGNLVWRSETGLQVSKTNRVFANLNDGVLPDYSDYFEQSTIDNMKIRLPIEGSRGCHWARCRFCFHNEGVRYRRKSTDVIINEIREQINKYGIFQISFLDNDIIGKDLDDFDKLLNKLTDIRKAHPEFHITRAEVVTRHTNADIVMKMAQAGFKDVQIGYESLSDNLLKAIQKCNSFSSNFLFVKWAMTYGIKIRGANLIMNLLEETEENLQESLDNMHFLRFNLNTTNFLHIYTTLWIKRSSKYFNILKKRNELEKWQVFKSFVNLPEEYIKNDNKYSLLFYVKPGFHPLWDNIEEMEWDIIQKRYSYTITEIHEDILYCEYENETKIVETRLLTIDWKILCAANRHIVGIDILKNILGEDKNKLMPRLDFLKKLGVIYFQENYIDIVTIINTEHLNNTEKIRYYEK